MPVCFSKHTSLASAFRASVLPLLDRLRRSIPEKLVTKLCQVDRLNRARSDKEPLLRIHAVGFGSGVHVPASFTLLMRDLSYRNNGTFIGLK